jgi:hypothetical protein
VSSSFAIWLLFAAIAASASVEKEDCMYHFMKQDSEMIFDVINRILSCLARRGFNTL